MPDLPEDALSTIYLLLRESRSARFNDPARMVYLAELAQAAANRLDDAHYSAPVIADAQARTWAELGNAYRLADALDHSQRAFAQAVDAAERGTGEPFLAAHIADLFATLLCHQRRYDEAFPLLERLVGFYLNCGAGELAGKTLLDLAAHALNSGDPEACVRYTVAGLDLLPEAPGTDLLLASVHNLLASAADLGHFSLVTELLPSVRSLYGSNRLARLRLRWLEGRVAAGSGNYESAESAFQEARAGFLEAGLGFAASLVSLDLALLLAEQARPLEIIPLAEEMLQTFRSLQLGREAILSVLLLRRSCESGALASEAIAERIRLTKRLLAENAPPPR